MGFLHPRIRDARFRWLLIENTCLVLYHFSEAFRPTDSMHSLGRLLCRANAIPGRGIRRLAGIAGRSTGDDEWNDAWESAWLPPHQAPWDTCTPRDPPANLDADTQAFVAEMDERWAERRAARPPPPGPSQSSGQPAVGEDSNGNKKKAVDGYRVKKQRIHAGLWVKEIEKLDEARLGCGTSAGDDIDRLLDSCSEIFDCGDIELNDSKILSTAEFKTKPDGWETTSKNPDGNIWNLTQREEDILLQEFERRIAFNKFQLASFIKTHIFSRRRPIDGWKYMIEEIGPNAKRGKGSVQRLPSLADPSTQPYNEEKPAIRPDLTSFKGR